MFGKFHVAPTIMTRAEMIIRRPINRDFTTTHAELRDDMIALADRVMATGGSLTWYMHFPDGEEMRS